jgi:hypothetical protein
MNHFESFLFIHDSNGVPYGGIPMSRPEAALKMAVIEAIRDNLAPLTIRVDLYYLMNYGVVKAYQISGDELFFSASIESFPSLLTAQK